ncbi:DMT family transporter [Celeribacter halophilus]|uniref:Permease of the drug/metabolite transporter (DMT) superfamily n=1 Tax=Celeribacter halophilus TaxID=576117 RepID=A0A1I3UF36_9RHOB|nr:DMT family transporter [Celeribacter halophilus]PZX10462.1 drug/metabolite transporter (DMT)-like permease [Celeribacter halophilus]SFJ82098.1 Permease of the drug/metabolite transporter (DMT) superfamily [Celeribacter halophilus]
MPEKLPLSAKCKIAGSGMRFARIANPQKNGQSPAMRTPQPSKPQDKPLINPVKGILWMLFMTLCFVMVNVLVKYVGTGLPVLQSAFLRFALGLVFLIPALGALRQVRFTPRIWKLTFGRAVFHSVAMTCWFFAMTRIPMGEVTSLNFMNPIYITIGAVILFGEKIALPRISALVVAFFGGLVILRPGFREIDPGHLAMVLSAMAFAGSYLIANRLVKELPASVVVFLMSVSVPIVIAPFALLHWETPTLHELLLLFLTAAFATLGHYSMTRAFACAPQSVVQPVVFVQLIWSVTFGYLLFGEAIDPFVMLGGAMIIGAISFITWRETRKKPA